MVIPDTKDKAKIKIREEGQSAPLLERRGFVPFL